MGFTTESNLHNLLIQMFANVMLYFCLDHLTECSIHALGMENNLLPNSAITASSVWPHPGHESWLARLNNVPIIGMSSGSWSAASNEAGQWLQIDLGEERLVTKLATQGRPSWDQWVTSYTILFSSHNVKWEEYKENDFVKVCDALVLFFSRGIFRIRGKAIATCHRQFFLILQNIIMLKHFVSVLLKFFSLYDCVIHLLIRI